MNGKTSWVQFGLLLVAIAGLALHNEDRLARVEQAVEDLKAQVTVLEQRIDSQAFTRRSVP